MQINVELHPALLPWQRASRVNFIHFTHIAMPFSKVNPVLMQVQTLNPLRWTNVSGSLITFFYAE